jgi:prepilin-type N-terminal cleavage/methylation domain-containing protein
MMRAAAQHGFTLIELLVSIAVISLMLGLLLPALGNVRETGRTASCLANQRQLVTAWTMYADAFAGRAMPLGHESPPDRMLYWWGEVVPSASGPEVVHETGFLSPFLDAALSVRSVYECAAQPWGTYRPQPMGSPAPGVPTSTYGYNGYYLSPPMTPGWRAWIGHRPWRRLADIERPSDLFVFGDALLPAGRPMNTALLDPPMLFSSGTWITNASPTTAFRHGARTGRSTVTGRADGSARTVASRPEWLIHSSIGVGSAGQSNGPHYIPDWNRW